MDQEIEWLSDFGLKGNCLIQFYLRFSLVFFLSPQRLCFLILCPLLPLPFSTRSPWHFQVLLELFPLSDLNPIERLVLCFPPFHLAFEISQGRYLQPVFLLFLIRVASHHVSHST